jgi:hypothetical protein
VAWDGAGDDGARLRSGVYLVRLSAGLRSMSRRVALLR